MRDSSKTALLVAGYRGRATEQYPALCNDPWALPLSGQEGLDLTYQFDAHFVEGVLWIGLRTAFFDAQVTTLTRLEHDPIPQVVILGAGLDSRAARLKREGIHFFEVDHPDTQKDKRRRLDQLPGYPPNTCTYVSCDFEQEDFLTRLIANGFRPDVPALFIWEGVTYYLSEGAVRQTLHRIATGCHPRTVVTFDFMSRRFVAGQLRNPADLITRAMVAEMNEPLIFGIDDPLPLLFEEGFRIVHTQTFDQICLNLTGTYERSRKFRFQGTAVASRAVETRGL